MENKILNDTDGNVTSKNKYVMLAEFVNQLVSDDGGLLEASWISLWTVVALGYAANLFLFFLLIRYRKTTLQSSANILILSLVCVDLITLFLITIIELYLVGQGIDECTGLPLSFSTFSAVFAAIVVTLLSIQKFIVVFFPLHAKAWLQRKKAIIAIVVGFLLTTGLVSPFWFLSSGMKALSEGDEHGINNIVAATSVDYVNHAMLLEALAACLAAAAILVTNPLIIYRLCRQKFPEKKMYNDAIKLAVATVLVFVFYLCLSLSKHLIWYSLALYKPFIHLPISPSLKHLIKYWVFVSSPVSTIHIVLNPILHALITENFRKLYLPSVCTSRSRNVSTYATGS